MVKIVVEEFDVCHKFSMTHYVVANEFTIFVDFNQYNLDICNMIEYIKNEAVVSDLSTYHWKVHRSLIQVRKSLSFSDFEKNHVLIFQLYKKTFWLVFRNLTEATLKFLLLKIG